MNRNTNVKLRLKTEIKKLRDEIVELRKGKAPSAESWEQIRRVHNFQALKVLKKKKELVTPNDGNISDIDFGANSSLLTLAAGAQCHGSVAVWNAITGEKQSYLLLQSSWMTAACLEKKTSDLLALASLENKLLVYSRNDKPVEEGISLPRIELLGHDAVPNDALFSSEKELLTAAGDKTLKLWDIENGRMKMNFAGHTGDVFCVSKNPNDETFISGAGDLTARLWDPRVKSDDAMISPTLTFDTGSRDVNGIDFFPEGSAFATALNNSEVYMYDTRASCKLLTFSHSSTYKKSSAEGVQFSPSGRLMFVRYSNKSVRVFDVAGPVRDGDSGPCNESSHDELGQTKCIMCMEVDKNGSCLAVGEVLDDKIHTIAHVYWPIKRSY